MKSVAFVVGLIVLASGVVINAQQKSGSAEQELIKLELDWANALVRADVVLLDRIIADEWVFTDPDGVIWTKAEVLALLKSGQDKVSSMVVDEMKALIYGDAAVVTGRNATKETLKGKDISGHYRFTDTWIKKPGPQGQMPGGVTVVGTPRWQCVATHASRVVEK